MDGEVLRRLIREAGGGVRVRDLSGRTGTATAMHGGLAVVNYPDGVERRLDPAQLAWLADAIVRRLKEFGLNRLDWSELDGETRTLIRGNADQGRPYAIANPFAFLIAVAFDRGMPWEKAWRIPVEIKRKGCLDPRQLVSKDEPQLIGLLKDLAVRPRWGEEQGAKTLSSAARLVCSERFGGDAGAIWRDRSPAEVEKTLQEIHGVGAGIASMATRILHDDFGYFTGQELSQIDVKPDVHLVRVFQRLGITRGDSKLEAIQAAQTLNREFPGALDWPAWQIGRRWCRPTKPDCANCDLTEACTKRGVESDPPSPSRG